MCEISIVIPVYETEKYVEQCLASVIDAELFKECEVLVIDDGSQDAGAEIAERVAGKYNNIQVYHFDNGGLSEARNRGMELAKGKYIFFLDSDDFLKKDYLSRLYEQAEKTQSDIVFAGFSEVREDGTFIRQTKRKVLQENREMDGPGFLNLRMNYGDWHNQVWCALYRKAFLNKHCLKFDRQIKLYEDILFTSQILLYAEHVRMIPEYGYMYRFHQNSLVHGGVKKRDIEGGMEVLEKLRESYQKLNPDRRRIFGRIFFEHISMLLYYIGQMNPENKKEYYKKLCSSEIMQILANSRTTPKEWIKYLIFRYCLPLYYPLVKKREKQGNEKKINLS